MIRVIDNKAINLTESEFKLYEQIVQAYTTPQFDGKTLFKNLFESDENGIIFFLKPPATSQSSLEVYLFLVSVMVHQHLRISTTNFDGMIKEGQSLIKEMREVLQETRSAITEMKALQAVKDSKDSVKESA